MSSDTPLRVRHASIQDFRGIDALELDFPEGDEPNDGGVLVIGGDNGCGKTSVLEALALGLGHPALLPPGAPFAEQVRFGRRDFTIKLDVDVADTRVPLTSHAEQYSNPQAQALSAVLLAGEGVPAPVRDFTRRTPNGVFWHDIALVAPRVVYITARRDADVPSNGTPHTDAQRIASLKRTLISLYNRRRATRTAAHREQPDRFARLQSFVQHFLGEDVSVDVMFVDDSDRNGQEVVLRWGDLPDDVSTLAEARARALTRGDVPVVLPIERLSSGQLSLFAFAEPLLFSTEAPDVALIDEPERHLHVQWQHSIVSALRELAPTTQLVLATHAHDILRSVTSEERVYLVPRDDPRQRAHAGGGVELAP